LTGFDSGGDRYVVGWLNVQRQDGAVSNITLEPFEWDESELYERLLPPKKPVEFPGFIKTKGGGKIEVDNAKKTIIFTPLPDEPATEIALAYVGEIKNVKAIDVTGKVLRDVPFVYKEGEKYPLVFTTQAGEFAYRVEWER
jgi:hypothetical protein